MLSCDFSGCPQRPHTFRSGIAVLSRVGGSFATISAPTHHPEYRCAALMLDVSDNELAVYLIVRQHGSLVSHRDQRTLL
jgi:hypothetical protein